VFSDNVAKALPTLRLTSGTPVTAGCRGVKSDAELAIMRHASAVTLKAYEAAWKSLSDGMTQNQFAGLVSAAHQRLGYRGEAGVQVGQYSALPHGSVTPQVIREGTILLIDGGCQVEGYSSDLSRTFVLGKATDRMKQVFEIEHKAQTAALKAARPGVECQAVDAAARKVITDAGFGPGYKNFTHRVGHGIGMDGHEWPYLVKGNTQKLEPGMTFSDEPGIYIPGEFGVRLEDDMIITAEGGAHDASGPSLEDPFGSAASRRPIRTASGSTGRIRRQTVDNQDGRGQTGDGRGDPLTLCRLPTAVCRLQFSAVCPLTRFGASSTPTWRATS
jgi:Xaa-Pro dipeptidase